MFKRKGGGVKGLLNNVQKNCTFLKGWLPLSRSSSLVLFTLFQRFQQCTSIFRFAEINFARKHLKAGKSLIGRIVIFPQCLKSLTLPPKIFYQPNLFKEVAKVWINLLFQVPSLVTPFCYVTWYFLSRLHCVPAPFVNHFTSSIQPLWWRAFPLLIF